jgi:DNA-binding NarL/FixJ family response regulator
VSSKGWCRPLVDVWWRPHFHRATCAHCRTSPKVDTHISPRRNQPTVRAPAVTRSDDGLTAREREVASLVAAGETNREIAEALAQLRID